MVRSVRTFKETLDMRRFSLRRLRSHKYATAVALGVLVLAIACVHIWQRVTVIQLAKDVARLQVERRELVDNARKVNSEVASLSMSARIETYAIDSLGLLPVPGDRLYTIVSERNGTPEARSDQLTTLVDALKRVGDHLPVLSGTEASAETTDSINFDSLTRGTGKK
jgi:cell division protein FtsL